MIILGIDPGTATTGFAVINVEKGSVIHAIKYGVITTDKALSDSERLKELAEDIRSIIKRYKPERVGVEKLYFETNQKTAMQVAQARGAVLLVLAEAGIPLQEFTPLQVKSTVCGYGKAQKAQVQRAVKMIFRLQSIPKPDDAADALAVAYCAINTKTQV